MMVAPSATPATENSLVLAPPTKSSWRCAPAKANLKNGDDGAERVQAVRAAAEEDVDYTDVAGNVERILSAAGVKTKPMEFQQVPIVWMLKKELLHEEEGGILAYPMGLGKTYMAIAYATAASHYERMGKIGKAAQAGESDAKPVQRPTLIVCPKTLVAYWKDEIQKHTNVGPYQIVVYHGPQRKHYDKTYLRTLRFIITTYEVVRNEASQRDRTSLLFDTHFARIFLDEAHRIRTANSQQTQAVMRLRSGFRWCVTGTPFNNRVSDLISLSQFINVAPFNLPNWWQHNSGGSKRHWRENYLMLREKPSWMPPVHTHEKTLSMDPEHAEFYKYIANMAASHYRVYCDSSPHQRKRLFNGLLVWLLRLRQTAIHPLLMLWAFEKRRNKCLPLSASASVSASASSSPKLNEGDGDGGERAIDGDDNMPAENDCDFIRNANPFDVPRLCKAWPHGTAAKGYTTTAKFGALLELVDTILREDDTKKIVVFSQWTSCLDLMEREFETKLSCRFRFMRLDGSIASAEERNGLVNTFRNDPTIRIFMSTTQAGGVGINLEMAQVVIMFDAWFNPFSEDQAVDRVHRVTQKRDVDVYRMRMLDTVETDVMRIQMVKRRKAKDELGMLNSEGPVGNRGDDQNVAMNSLSKDEVCSIFRRRGTGGPSIQISVAPPEELTLTDSKSATASSNPNSRKRTADGACLSPPKDAKEVMARMGLAQRNFAVNKKARYG